MQAAVYYKERYEQKGRVSMKKIFSNKKVMGTLAAVMAAALLLGGTFAWRDISQNAQNVFKASSYEAELVDIFTPPSNWEKDENINKDVYVKNTGSGDIFVRVNFDDILKLAGASEQAQNPYTAFNVNGDGTADTTSFSKFEWAMGSGLIYDIADWNGCTDAWYLDATTGWFYWGNVLNSGTQTDKLLDAVKLLTDVDKDFEYIINVNMHAFSADQKGIEDLEDTDGGSANVPDEVKDMVNGIVSNNDKAVQKKAEDARKAAEEIQAKIDAGDYDSDASAKTAAEKAVEDYNKAADKYEEALTKTGDDKKAVLEEADNLAAIANSYATSAESHQEASGLDSSSAKYFLVKDYAKSHDMLAEGLIKLSETTETDATEDYKKAIEAINSRIKEERDLVDRNAKGEELSTYVKMLGAINSTRYDVYMKRGNAKQDTLLPDYDQIISACSRALDYLDKAEAELKKETKTNKSAFYTSTAAYIYSQHTLNDDIMVDETEYIALRKYTSGSFKDQYALITAACNATSFTIPNEYKGINIVTTLSTLLQKNELIEDVIIPKGIIQLEGLRWCPNLKSVTFDAQSNVKTVKNFMNYNGIEYFIPTAIKTITLPTTVTSLTNSFAEMEGLTVN